MLLVGLYLVLLMFCLSQIRVLAVAYMSWALRRRPRAEYLTPVDFDFPSVAVQLPVYREHLVLDRLLSAVVSMDYPRGRLSVQVIDDSEEDEAALCQAVLRRYQAGPVPVEYLRRPSRAGYKSGALNFGNSRLDADLIAIFDADFVPGPEFLQKTVPLFKDERVAAVHARWTHQNGLKSPLTMIQAAILDTLFLFENQLKQAIHESGMYLGTSGVWRKKAVDELGGWREAPFTDDGIDLSYRAQLAGWRLAFVGEPLSSADVPPTYLAYKSQQRRWARAALRLAVDYAGHVFQAAASVRGRLLEISLLHLVFSTPCLLLAALLSTLYVGLDLPRTASWLAAQFALLVAVAVFPPAQEVLLSQRLLYPDWRRRWGLAIRGFPLAIGLSLSIVAGFCDTFRDSRMEFVRTPKQGSDAVMRGSRGRWLQSAAWIAALEVLVATAALLAATSTVVKGYPEALPLLLFVSGAFWVCGFTSWREIAQQQAGTLRAAPAGGA